MGQVKISYHNTEICIYNVERMLIELVRFRGKLPFDYYKEIIGSYRNCVETMDIAKVEEYAAKFKHSDVSDFFISCIGKKVGVFTINQMDILPIM